MKKTVLLVEDYVDSREAMKLMIELAGYQVIAAENGLEALKLIAQEPVDLILMDISMPVMDGRVAIKVIKQHKPASKVPIIAVTAHSGKYRDEIMEAGAAEIIQKPVEMDFLQATLAKYL